MHEWVEALRRGSPDRAWDLFLARYRRLLFAAIRHYVRDYDDVMDVFTHVCDALRADDLRRLREYADASEHRARFTTWLVTVVRHLAVDWFRARDGRPHAPALAARLTPLQRAVFEHVFISGRSHLECYALLQTNGWPALTFRDFLAGLRTTYQLANGERRGALWQDIAAPLPDEPDSAELLVSQLSYARVQEAFGTLSDSDRVAVQLYVIDGLDAASVARVLALPGAKAVYNKVYRALAGLREQLERAGIQRTDV